jgi:hypothetical protein
VNLSSAIFGPCALLPPDRLMKELEIVKKFILGLVVGIVLLPAAAFLYVWFGFAPVATSASPLPFERTIAGMALDARVAK